ncbi:rCG50130, partial [Rattus norvegicus]
MFGKYINKAQWTVHNT